MLKKYFLDFFAVQGGTNAASAGRAGAAEASDADPVGRFVDVEITEALANSLRGRLPTGQFARRA
jgi:TRAM domain